MLYCLVIIILYKNKIIDMQIIFSFFVLKSSFSLAKSNGGLEGKTDY